MMIGWAVLLKVVVGLDPAADSADPGGFLVQVASAGILVNALLMVFNLFPLLPLDGGRIVAGLLPNRLSYQYSRLEPYGMFILISLLVSHVLDPILGPLAYLSAEAVYSLIGIFWTRW